MRNLLFLIFMYALLSCDKESCTEEVISNKLDTDVFVNFVSSDALFNSRIFVEKQSVKTVGQVECALGGVVLNYSVYDSIYIQNSSNEVLKVFKQDTPGKNIYNVDEYWTVREPSKNHFVYTYEITDEDIGY